ncbi:hypothetical protein EC968_007633 [Mortierella alpina]|nr:hypothetical protein EC968_007633 [Mortierella alpina]
MIRAADCTSYHGDILVGADGARSSVRQELYKSLKKVGIVPTQQKFIARSHNILCGVTVPLDPEQYPGIDDEHSNVTFIQSKGTPHSWATFTVRNNAICWSVLTPIPEQLSKKNLFHSSLWGPQPLDLMAKEVYEFKTIYGKLGDLIDQTPRDSLDGQSLETVLFDVWHHGRTILIGDAAHQVPQQLRRFTPHGMNRMNINMRPIVADFCMPLLIGGAFYSASTLHAIQDAVGLANHIYDIKRFSHANVSTALKDFTEHRFPQMRAHFIQNGRKVRSTKKLFIYNVWRKLTSGRRSEQVATRKRSEEVSEALRCKYLPLTSESVEAPAQSQEPSQCYTQKTEVSP